MRSLEQEVIEKFQQLDKEAQRRVRDLLLQEAEAEAETDASAFDYDSWFHDVEKLRQEIRASHGDAMPSMDVVGLLRGIRDGEDE